MEVESLPHWLYAVSFDDRFSVGVDIFIYNIMIVIFDSPRLVRELDNYKHQTQGLML